MEEHSNKRIVKDCINHVLNINGFKSIFYVINFIVKPLKTCFYVFIFLSCVDEELSYGLFSHHVYSKMGDEFNIEISEDTNAVRLYVIVPSLRKFIRYYRKDFTYSVFILCYKP